MTEKTDQLLALATLVAYEGDTEPLVEEIKAQDPSSGLLLAMSSTRAWMYWFPSEYRLRKFLERVASEQPDDDSEALFWLIGIKEKPIDLGPSPDARSILSHFH